MELGRQIPRRMKSDGHYKYVQRLDGSIAIIPELEPFFDASQANNAAALPDKTDWTAKAMASIRRMYANDRLGDCVIASLYHKIGVWTANDGSEGDKPPVVVPDSEVVNTYHNFCGPGDNGCDISAVLQKTRDIGVPVNGATHKIDSFVSVNNTNKDLVRAAIALFACLKLGIDLPAAWEQGGDGSVWDLTNSHVVGGHDVPAIDYTPDGVIISTWAGTRRITWPAFLSRNYISECYAVLSPDWYGKDGIAGSGFDLATLKANLTALGNGQIPPFGPPPQVPLDWLI